MNPLESLKEIDHFHAALHVDEVVVPLLTSFSLAPRSGERVGVRGPPPTVTLAPHPRASRGDLSSPSQGEVIFEGIPQGSG